MKSYGVTIQLKPLQQYFSVVPFAFHHFKKMKSGILSNLATSGSEKVKKLLENVP